MSFALKLVNGIPRMVNLAGSIYDETYTVPNGGLITGTNITLPSSGTYVGAELTVFLNGQYMQPVVDYTYVGSGTKTQIAFTFDLLEGELVRFRKEV